MDLTVTWQGVILPWLIAFGLALTPIVGGIVGTVILREMRKRNLDTAWFEAIERAAGDAYAFLLTSGAAPTSKVALAAAAKVGADYLAQRVPGIVAKKALDPQALAQIAGAQIGKLLAADPTVTLASGDTTPAGFSATATRTL